MDKWHVGRGGKTFGPYPWAQIVEMTRTGQLAAADLLWQEGTSGWLPASTFAGRLPFPAGAGVPPLPPGPAAPAQPGVAAVKVKAFGRNLGFHAKRATEWNLHNLTVLDEETKLLVDLGVDDEDARKFHAWRRSVLVVAFWAGILTATLGTVIAGQAKHEEMNELGNGLELLRVCFLWVIPIFAFRAGRAWTRHKRSRRLLGIGWTISFIAPLLMALIPMHWRLNMGDAGEARAQFEATVRLLGAISAYLTLMPAVLALIPGIMRACLRIKVLLPQSIIPGWFLVATAPFWMFLFLVVFVTINQVAGDWLLILGVLAVTTAPVLYLVHVGLFTRPIMSPQDQQRLLQIQKQVRYILIAGVALMVIWLFTASVFGKQIIGTDENTSLMRPWSLDLYRFPIEFATHSLFTMALASDLFMAMNLSVWRYTKEFVAAPAARDYDRRMAEIEEAGEKD